MTSLASHNNDDNSPSSENPDSKSYYGIIDNGVIGIYINVCHWSTCDYYFGYD